MISSCSSRTSSRARPQLPRARLPTFGRARPRWTGRARGAGSPVLGQVMEWRTGDGCTRARPVRVVSDGGPSAPSTAGEAGRLEGAGTRRASRAAARRARAGCLVRAAAGRPEHGELEPEHAWGEAAKFGTIHEIVRRFLLTDFGMGRERGRRVWTNARRACTRTRARCVLALRRLCSRSEARSARCVAPVRTKISVLWQRHVHARLAQQR